MKQIRSLPFDIISDMPSNVIEIILRCLPIRDAVRTSTLAKKWRYSWVNLPALVFDETLSQESTENQMSTKNKLVLTIYQVLLLHQGPILEFTLSIPGLESCSEIDQSILFLSRNGVEQFTLHIWRGEPYKLPSSFFSCLQLTHLDISSCVFKPPPTFKGFSMLISLKFEEVVFAAEIFGSFISSCPLLERLSLISSASFDYFEINAPKLKFLCFSMSLKEEYLKGGQTANLIEFFGHLPVIENLQLCFYLFKALVAGGLPKKLPTTVIHLKILELSDLCFDKLDEVVGLLCLIISCPNLQKITVEMFASKDAVTGPVLEFLKEQDYSDVIFDQLQEAKMQLVSGTQPELEFIKLLLAKSPTLETMIIQPRSGDVADRLKMLQKLTQFQRASPEAQIFYEDPLPS